MLRAETQSHIPPSLPISRTKTSEVLNTRYLSDFFFQMKKVLALTNPSALVSLANDQSPMIYSLTYRMMINHPNFMWGPCLFTISFASACRCFSLRLNIKSGEPDGSPGFRNQKAGIKKRRTKLYRDSRTWQAEQEKTKRPNSLIIHWIANVMRLQAIYIACGRFDDFKSFPRSNMPRIHGGCEA